MTPETLLLRQIHPIFIQDGRPTSQGFRPTPKDEERLSTDDGDRISPADAWTRFTQSAGASVEVMGILVRSCKLLKLSVDPDGDPHPEHVSVIFSGKPNKQCERISKQLRDEATQRGWLHLAAR